MSGGHTLRMTSGRWTARLLALFPLALLAACASGTSTPAPRPTPATPSRPQPKPLPTRPAPPATSGFIKPKVMKMPGLEGVIGANASALTRMFGQPELDVREADARKLQFRGKPCVLDVYLYPYAPGGEPRATYVDARRASDGKDVNRASCVAAIRR